MVIFVLYVENFWKVRNNFLFFKKTCASLDEKIKFKF